MSEACCHGPSAPLSRRGLLTALGVLPVAAAIGAAPAAAEDPSAVVPAGAPPGLLVFPRASWAQGRAPKGPLLEEEVRFLLVHHTASPNGYARDRVPALLRSFYAFHTGAERGWPDLAYNFLVDAYGGVWEGRTGSLAGAVQASATGGSQGFAQLACFIGDHTLVLPSAEARSSMTRLLAWMAERHDVDTRPGTTVQFVSRGSSRWASGQDVLARTISAHRDMSETSCPGDALYADVVAAYARDVTALRPSTVPTPTPTAAATSSPAPPTVQPTRPPSPTVTAAASPSPLAPPHAAAPVDSGPSPSELLTTVIGATAVAAGTAAAAAGVVAFRRTGGT